MKKWIEQFLSARSAFYLVGIGLLLTSAMLFAFTRGESFHFGIVNSDKIGHFGDFVGGVVGSLWALAGVILFYIALQDQRKDYATNQANLVIQNNNLRFQAENIALQTRMLESQIEEFKLQKEELEATRKVFEGQLLSQHAQRFETTFFQQLHFLRDIVEKINFGGTQGMKSFDTVINAAHAQFLAHAEISPNHVRGPRVESGIRDAAIYYRTVYDNLIKHHFGHYLSFFEIVVRYIDSDTVISDENKDLYYHMLTSQLSQSELRLIFIHFICSEHPDMNIVGFVSGIYFQIRVDFNQLPFFHALYYSKVS